MTKRPPTPPAHDLPPLLPLEYCRPERATRLLKCELEDLYHWAAIGAINVYVIAQKAESPSLVTMKQIDHCHLLGRSKKLKFGASFFHLPRILENDPGGDWITMTAVMSGFWAIRKRHFVQWEENGVIELSDDGIIELSSSFADDNSTVWAKASFSSITDNLWLMREDLEKIRQHIINGTPFEFGDVEQPPEPMNEPAPPRGPTPKQAQAILAMALHLYGPKREVSSVKSVYDTVVGKLARDGLTMDVTEKQFGNWLRDGGLDAIRNKNTG